MHFTRCNEYDLRPESGHVALATEALSHPRFVSRILWYHALFMQRLKVFLFEYCMLGGVGLTTCASAAGHRARAHTILRFLSGGTGERGPSGAQCPLRPVGCTGYKDKSEKCQYASTRRQAVLILGGAGFLRAATVPLQFDAQLKHATQMANPHQAFSAAS
jgi:hypothetical protein